MILGFVIGLKEICFRKKSQILISKIKIIMDNKTLSIISYITFIGWLVSYFSGKDTADDNLKYHLRQSLGLVIFTILLSVVLNIVIMVTHLSVLSIVGFLPLVLMILGIINAANEVKKPLPVIGKMFEDKFSFVG
jgi:uncharacterized membrane protein